MPTYGTWSVPTAISQGDSAAVWKSENVASGAASERVALGWPFNISISLQPPGFSVTVEAADVDTDAMYGAIPSAVITAPKGSVAVKANFLRLRASGAGTAVTATITSSMGGGG